MEGDTLGNEHADVSQQDYQKSQLLQDEDELRQSGLHIDKVGHNPLLDGSIFERINTVRGLVKSVKQMRNGSGDELGQQPLAKQVGNALVSGAKGVMSEAISAPDQNMYGRNKYNDKAQSDMSFIDKVSDVGRSFGALFGSRDRYARPSGSGPTAEQREQLSARGHFARSMEITRSQFLDTGEQYKGFKGFFRKTWTGMKSLVGSDIKENRQNYEFNNYLMLSDVVLEQVKEGENRRFKVNAVDTAVFIHLNKFNLTRGFTIKHDSWKFKKFEYIYNISEDQVERRAATIYDTAASLGNLELELKDPTIVFDPVGPGTMGIEIAETNLQINLDSESISDIKGSMKGLEINPSGLKWESASASIGAMTIADVLSFSSVNLNFDNKEEDLDIQFAISKGVAKLGLGKYGGKDIDISIDDTVIQKRSEGWRLKIDSGEITTGSGVLGDISFQSLDVDFEQEQVEVGKIGFTLDLSESNLPKMKISGSATDVYWSEGDMDFGSATGALQGQTSFAGFTLTSGAAVTLIKNPDQKRIIIVESGLELQGGSISGGLKNARLTLTELSDGDWDYEVGGTDKGELEAVASLAHDSFGLQVKAQGIQLASKKDLLTKDRKTTASINKLATTMELLGTKTTGEFVGITNDNGAWSYERINFILDKGHIGEYLSLKDSTSFSIIQENSKQIATGEQVDPKYRYEFNLGKAEIRLGPVAFDLSGNNVSVEQLDVVMNEEAGAVALPKGWLFTVDNVDANLSENDETKVLTDLGARLKMNKLVINTQTDSGSLNELYFNGMFFGNGFQGSVQKLTWNQNDYDIGKWQAGLDEIKLGSLISLSSAKFFMAREQGKVIRKLTLDRGEFRIPPTGDFHIDGNANGLEWLFDEKKFTANEAGLGIAVGDNKVSAKIKDVLISEQDGFNFSDVIVTTSQLSLFDDNLRLSNLSLGLHKDKSSIKTASIGGDVTVGENLKVFKIIAGKAELTNNLQTGEFAGAIKSLKVDFSGFAAEANNVSFTESAFVCTFDKKPEFDESFSMMSLFNPIDVGLFSMRKLFGSSAARIIPDKISYSKETGFKFEKLPNEKAQGEQVKLPFFKGYINASNPEDSTLQLNSIFPNSFKDGNQSEAETSVANLTPFGVLPLFSVGLFSIFININLGTGFAVKSDIFKPKLKDTNGNPKLKFDGDIKLSACGAADIALSAAAGAGISVAAEAFFRGSVFSHTETNKINVTMEKEGKDGKFKFVGAESGLKLDINGALLATIGMRLRASIFGKSIGKKELKFVQKELGQLQGSYRFRFGMNNGQELTDTDNEGSSPDKYITTITKLNYTERKDIDGLKKDLEDSKQSYQDALQEADNILVLESEKDLKAFKLTESGDLVETTEQQTGEKLNAEEQPDQKAPRKSLVVAARKAQRVLDKQITGNRNNAYMVVQEFAKFSSQKADKIDKFRKMVFKHEYRIRNERLFQEGLRNWNPKESIIPTYKFYDTSKLGQFKFYVEQAQIIFNTVRDLKRTYDNKRFLEIIGHIKTLNTSVKNIMDTEKMPEREVKAGNRDDELRFYRTILPQVGNFAVRKTRDSSVEKKYAEHATEKVSQEGDKIVKDKKEGIILTQANRESFQKDLSARLREKAVLKDPLRLARNVAYLQILGQRGYISQTAESEVGEELLNNHINLQTMTVKKLSIEKGSKKLEGHQQRIREDEASKEQDFFFSGTTLMTLYSDHAVEMARKEAAKDVNEMLIRLTADKANAFDSNSELASLLEPLTSEKASGQKKQTEEKANVIKEMLVHKYVRKHTQSRIDFYTQKLDKIQIDVKSYEDTTKELDERYEALSSRNTKLTAMIANQNELITGSQAVIGSWDQIKTGLAADLPSVSKVKIGRHEAETKTQKEIINNTIQDLETAYNEMEKAEESQEAE